MTIISNYNNLYHPGLKLSSSRHYQRRRATSWRFNLQEIGDHFGHIKIFVLSIALVVILAGYWLMIFGDNISLNYKIYQLKGSISKLERNTNILRERASEAISDQELSAWAQANNFTEIGEVSYLSLENNNLAQAQQDNF